MVTSARESHGVEGSLGRPEESPGGEPATDPARRIPFTLRVATVWAKLEDLPEDGDGPLAITVLGHEHVGGPPEEFLEARAGTLRVRAGDLAEQPVDRHGHSRVGLADLGLAALFESFPVCFLLEAVCVVSDGDRPRHVPSILTKPLTIGAPCGAGPQGTKPSLHVSAI